MSICPFLILWWYWPVTVAADVVAVGPGLTARTPAGCSTTALACLRFGTHSHSCKPPARRSPE